MKSPNWDMGGGAKTFWVIFVIIIPWLGILVYLIARGSGMHERQLEQMKQVQQAQAEYIKSVAGPAGGGAADQIASAKKPAGQRHDHPGRVRQAQGEGARQLTGNNSVRATTRSRSGASA